MRKTEADLDRNMAMLVGRYTIPLAVCLVCMAIALSQPVGGVRAASIAIALIGVVFNLAANRVLHSGSTVITRWRVWINLGLNSALFWMLGGIFEPIWLLLALTPMATAVYGGRHRTMLMSGIVGSLLLGFRAARSGASPIEWGHAGAHALFVVLISLLIDEVSTSVRRNAAALDHSAQKP